MPASAGVDGFARGARDSQIVMVKICKADSVTVSIVLAFLRMRSACRQLSCLQRATQQAKKTCMRTGSSHEVAAQLMNSTVNQARYSTRRVQGGLTLEFRARVVD